MQCYLQFEKAGSFVHQKERTVYPVRSRNDVRDRWGGLHFCRDTFKWYFVAWSRLLSHCGVSTTSDRNVEIQRMGLFNGKTKMA